MKFKIVEIDMKSKTVTLKSKEGYPIARSTFKSLDEATELANKKANEMIVNTASTIYWEVRI